MNRQDFLDIAQDTLHNQQIGLFDTKTITQLEAYIGNLNGSEKAIAALIYGLTWNTAMNSAANLIERHMQPTSAEVNAAIQEARQ